LLDYRSANDIGLFEYPVRLVIEQKEFPELAARQQGRFAPFPVLEELRAAGYVHYAIAPMVFSDATANAVS
jgi:hypothetical protein